MCFAFMCSLSHGCRWASWQTFWQLYYFTTFYFLSCWLVAMAVLKGIVSLYRAREEKPIERYKTRVEVAERINYFRRSKKYYRVPWAQRGTLKVRLGVIWPEILPADENQWQGCKVYDSTSSWWVMKDWLDNYRPVCQRTMRSETTRDKARTLPSAVY